MTLTGEDVAIVGVWRERLGQGCGQGLSWTVFRCVGKPRWRDSGVSIGELDGHDHDRLLRQSTTTAMPCSSRKYIGMSTRREVHRHDDVGIIDRRRSGRTRRRRVVIRSGTLRCRCGGPAGTTCATATSRDDAVKVMANNYEREYEKSRSVPVAYRRVYAFIARRFNVCETGHERVNNWRRLRVVDAVLGQRFTPMLRCGDHDHR